MTADDEIGRTGAALPVRTRHTLGSEQATSEDTVHCARRGVSVAMTDCLACEECEGAVCDSSGTYLFCTHPAAQRAALAELMRQPLFSSAADRTPLSAVMTGDVICVSPDLPLDELVKLFVQRSIGGVPVVDQAGRAIGVVSKSDVVLRCFERDDPADPGRSARARWPRGSLAPRTASLTVADLMMPIAFTLPESATLSRAAALMAFEGIHRIPVVSLDGRVVGIVSSLDLVRWMAQSDGYLLPGSSTLARRGPGEGE